MYSDIWFTSTFFFSKNSVPTPSSYPSHNFSGRLFTSLIISSCSQLSLIVDIVHVRMVMLLLICFSLMLNLALELKYYAFFYLYFLNIEWLTVLTFHVNMNKVFKPRQLLYSKPIQKEREGENLIHLYLRTKLTMILHCQ